jgi:hypothetical protein
MAMRIEASSMIVTMTRRLSMTARAASPHHHGDPPAEQCGEQDQAELDRHPDGGELRLDRLPARGRKLQDIVEIVHAGHKTVIRGAVASSPLRHVGGGR